MRLDEIEPSDAAERHVKQMKAIAKVAADKAKQLKAQASATADRLELQKSKSASPDLRSSMAGTIKPTP